MSEIQIFNRDSLKSHRNRSADKLEHADFLFQEVASRMADQFGSTIAKKFSNILELGSRSGILHEYLKDYIQGGSYIAADISDRLLMRNNAQQRVICDDELLPFRSDAFDLIISNLSLHTVNDLPGSLVQIRRSLKKGGMFVASLFGIETLKEIKQILAQAEIEVSGTTSPRIFPYVDVRSGAALLQRVNFSEAVSINETIKAEYDNIYDLFVDLKNMGESNILLKAAKTIPSRRLFEVANEMFLQTNREVSFEIVYISGWKF